MRLSLLLQDICSIPASLDCEITGLQLDSRQISKNNLFFALQGEQADGRRFINDAIARGAAVILSDAETQECRMTRVNQVPVIPIMYLRKHCAQLAARFYHYPANQLRMIGVTGTSGKTSCTHFIAQMLRYLNKSCGLIGSLGSGIYPALGPAGLTTPDVITIQKTLSEFVVQGVEAVSMEVSSHSIAQRDRIEGIDFAIGAFTNLTQDHLDYHGDMATYAAVKYSFLAGNQTKQLIINADDPLGNRWITELSTYKSVLAVSTQHQHSLASHVPLIYCDQINLSLQGIHAQVHSPWGVGQIIIPLIGEFNLTNVLITIATLSLYGVPWDEIIAKISQLQSVPGRMQILGGKGQPLVVVDYAHKPDALEKVLRALRTHVPGRLICVFGCGGDRDRSKRPLMGSIAEVLADQVIITNDNPRSENPADIVAEILQGMTIPDRAIIELDRSKAIEKSIQWASIGDCVLIAGKGAERYQQIGEEKIPFDDVECALGYLS